MSTQLTDDELTAFIPERLASEWQASRTHPNCKWDADAVVDFFRELALSRAENARLQERVEEAEADTRRWKGAKGESDDVIRRIVTLVPRDVEREDIIAAVKRTVRERDEAKALAERRKEALEPIVFGLRYDDFGDEDWLTWERCVRRWEDKWKPALQEEHFGDCTKQPTACFRCQAEDVVRVAGLFRAALQGKTHVHEWIDARNEVVKSGEMCACGAIRAQGEKE